MTGIGSFRRSAQVAARRASIAIFIAICAQFAVPKSIEAAGPTSDRLQRVLILHAYNFTFPATTIVSTAARNRIIEGRQGAVQIDADFLDLARRPDEAHALRTATFLRDKYSDVKFDLILAIGIAAADFSAKFRDIFAPGVPVVLGGGNLADVQPGRFPPDITGVVSNIKIGKILDLAEGLQPSARRVFVIGGNSKLDRSWQQLARDDLKARESKFEITYRFDFEYQALLAEVSRLPSDSIVILLTAYADRNGMPLVPRNVAEAVAKASKAPVYGPFETFLSNAIVGGYMETYESLGAAVGDKALQLLAGTDPRAMPIDANAGQQFRVDAQAVKRWGLSRRNLPVGTVVLFDDKSIWQSHRDLVILALSALGLQSLLLAGLLLQRRRRHKAEALLRESEERMTFTAAAANIALWQFDPETGRLWATEHCRSLLGIATDKPLARDTIVDAIHPEDRDAALAALKKAANGSAVVDFRVNQDGSQLRWIRARARAESRSGAQARVNGIFVDVTDQRAAEAEAEEQRKEVAHLMRVSVMGELSGAIAHEVNQPLTAILSNAQAALHMLGQEAPEMAEIREAIKDIVDENNRASEVIQRMRRLLKKGERRYEAVDINELINSTIGLLNSEAISRRIKLETDLDEKLPYAEGDAVQLQQVLLNLLMNAMDSMTKTPAAQRLVSVRSRATRGHRIEVLVEDCGCGIGAIEPRQVFQPFYTTKDHGLGLGLSICSTIMRAHGGQLTLRNGERGGAIAAFYLAGHRMQVAAQ